MNEILLRRRMAMMQQNSQPFDAEVEYLYSYGSAYIDSGIEATGDLSVEFSIKPGNNNNAAMCGAIYNRGSNSYYRTHVSTRYWYNNTELGDSSLALLATSNFYHVHLDVDSGTLTVNNSVTSFTPVSFTCNCNYGIFARLSANMNVQAKPSAFAWFKMRRNGVLLRDFIPVRVGTTGYLYDRVSGQLFGNAGTGRFTLGNDKTS